MHRSIHPETKQTARVYLSDGRILHFNHQPLAYHLWLALPSGTRAAFRGKEDTRPVYPWDFADRP